jgi:hypothetical protein
MEHATGIDGPYRLETTSDISLRSSGRGIYLTATNELGRIGLEAATAVSLEAQPAQVAVTSDGADGGHVLLRAGDSGTILQTAGSPDLGARIALGKDGIVLSVGVPGVGPKITLTSDSIVFSVGLTKFKMTATGIEESLAVVSRKLAATGHNLKAAETDLKVDVTGIAVDAPILKQQAQGLAQFKTPLEQTSIDGMEKAQAGMTMLS